MKRISQSRANKSSEALKHIYLGMTLFNFGSAMTSLFVPIYLLSLGYNMVVISLFYLIYALSKLVYDIPTFHLVAKHSAKLGFSIGILSKIMSVLLLIAVDSRESLLFAIPLFMSLSDGFLWTSSHVHISGLLDKRKGTSQLGKLINLGRIAGALAPLAGGAITTAIDFQAALIASISIMVLSLLPILKSVGAKDVVKDYTFKWLNIGQDMLANFAWQGHTAVGFFVWPLYLFLFIDDYRSIGAVITFSVLASIGFTYWAGTRGDKGKLKKMLLESSIITSMVHFSRPFFSSFIPLLSITTVADLVHSYQSTAWTAAYYKNARAEDTLNYVANMEIAGDLARILFWIVLLSLSLVVTLESVLVGSFIFGGVAGLGVALMPMRQK